MITRTAGTFFFVGLAVSSLGCNKIKSMAGGGEGSLAVLKDFEGEIGVMAKSAKADAKTVNVLLEVKGDKVRADVPEELAKENPLGRGAPAGKLYGILRSGEKKAFVVMEAQKQAIVFDLNKFAEKIKSSPPSLSSGSPGAPSKEPPKVTKTGKTEKVAGFECENWDVVNSDGAKATVCVGSQGPSWFSLPLTGIATEHAWMAELLDGKHFPLRVVAFDKAGAEQGRMEVTKIEKKSIDAAKFEVPAGFQTMDLEQLMAQMMSGLGGMGMPPGAMGSGRPGMPRLPPGFKPPVGQPPHR